jgi:hypothetical protein
LCCQPHKLEVLMPKSNSALWPTLNKHQFRIIYLARADNTHKCH